MVIRANVNPVMFDPIYGEALASIESSWMERLTADDWTLDPAIFDYTLGFRPNDYVKGHLAESWEFPDPSTYLIHLRKGIKWQDLPPVNGREFVAADVIAHYVRLYGAGAAPASAYYSTVAAYKSLTAITSPDKYTVAFKWSVANPEFIMENMQANGAGHDIEAPEVVAKYGNTNDWHNAVGTGPFILKDYVSDSSATLVKNPNYWGYDERYPQNKLPYVDSIKILIIPNQATALSGLRTGKIDAMDGLQYQTIQLIKQSNPEILSTSIPLGTCISLDPRNDTAPFSDIKVRKALQMAIDLPTIAKTYYAGTAEPYPSSLTSRYLTGWGLPYEQWPQDLKDEYAYNPVAAKKLLADAGFPNGFKTNIVADSAGDIDLLQVIKSYFLAIGVDMDIRTMDSASWIAFVQTSKKYDAMAQRATTSLGLTFEPLRQLNKFQKSYTSNIPMVNDPIFEAFYDKAMAATSMTDIKKILKDANLYVAQQHFAISVLQPKNFALYQPWLKGFHGQNSALTGPSCPRYLYFYGSRFWIDQSLKKAAAH
jgi:peptide/nickel transport system substrate-binding protein